MSTFDLNAGALAPVADEVHVDELSITGTIPDGLDGLLVRIGPNPYSGRFEGETMLDWWTAPGMTHGLAIGDGRARWYRNRWTVPSDRITDQPFNSNVNVVEFAGKILALGEGGQPLELSRSLEPRSSLTFNDRLPRGMMAHPKLDPTTGELRFFRADWQAPYLQVGAIDAERRLTSLREVSLPRPVMMHDFAATPRFDVLLDTNVVLDASLLGLGIPLPLRWDEEHQTRIGIAARDGSGDRWYEIEPCFIQHVVNAYEIAADEPGDGGDRVVLEAVRYSYFLRFDPESAAHEANPLGLLWRYEINLLTGAVTETQLDDRFVELPRIDERRVGQRNDVAFVVEQPTDAEMRGIRRYNLRTGSSEAFAVPPGDQNSEAVFADGGAGEGEGWLLCCVYRAASHTTDVVILDAESPSSPPAAIVHLPRHIPAGFHGAWIPSERR